MGTKKIEMEWFGCNLPFRPTPVGECAWFPHDTLPPIPEEHKYVNVKDIKDINDVNVLDDIASHDALEWCLDLDTSKICKIDGVEFALDEKGVYVVVSQPRKYVESSLGNFIFRLTEWNEHGRLSPMDCFLHEKSLRKTPCLHYVNLFYKTLESLNLECALRPPVPQILYRFYQVRSCTNLVDNFTLSPLSVEDDVKRIYNLIVEEKWDILKEQLDIWTTCSSNQSKFDKKRLEMKDKLEEKKEDDMSLSKQIDALESVLEMLEKKKRKRHENGKNKTEDSDLVEFRDFLIEYDSHLQVNDNIVLFPRYWKPTEAPDVFSYLEEWYESDKSALLSSILEFRTFFTGGKTEIELNVYGKLRGYKGRDTSFNKYEDDEVEVHEDYSGNVIFYGHGMETPDFEFFGGCVWPNDKRVTDVDWGDWDTTRVTATYTVELYWMKFKNY